MTSEDIRWKYSGEVTTCNKFELLNQEDTYLSSTSQENTYSSRKKKENFEFSSIPDSNFISIFNLNDSQDEPIYVDNDIMTQKSVLNNSFDEFMVTKNKLLNSNKHYMYSNKNNFCSGYFPDFITLDNDIGYSISEGNNYSHYYLYTKNNSYLKPLSNPMSKYNNKYFDDMNFAYKICKKT